MAVSTLGILILTVTCVLGSPVGSDPTPECTSVCKDGACPLKLTLLDSEECVCRLMYMNPIRSKQNIRLRCKNESVEMRLPKRFQPEWESTLVIKGQDEQLTCYKVEKVTERSPSSETRNRTKKKIKIQCSQNDESLVHDVFLLNGNKRYNVHPSLRNVTGCRIAQRRTVPQKTRDSKGCQCWAPSQVIIHRVGNSTLTVEWMPFYAHKDVRVRVERVKPRRKKDDRDKTLWNYQLCDKKLRSLTFTNFDPGTYVAMVGAQGCDCMLYTESDRITIGEKTEVKNTLIPVAIAGSSESPGNEGSTKIIILVVGAFAVIGTVSLGLTIYFKKRRAERYDPVRNEPDEPRITVLLDQRNDNISDIATSIKTLLNKPDIKVMRREELGEIIRADELLVLVSLQDFHTFQDPAIDSCHWSSTITVLRDYTKEEGNLDSNLVVHIPRDIEHPSFRACRNDARRESRLLSLRDALRHMNPECDFDCDEYRDLINGNNERLLSRDDEIKDIFLLSGFVHDHHNKACLELAKMLQQMNKRVAYAYDESNRKDIQAEGPSQWTLGQLKKADLVVVVVSKFLYKLIDCYTKEKQVPELNQNLAICAPLAIKQMSMRNRRPKIAYVDFGYESLHLDKMVHLHPRLGSDMRYSLVEAKQTEHRGDDTGEHHALRVFLSRLSSDRTSIDAVCRNSRAFFEHVTAMAAMMAKDPKWLSRTYGSMESLASFFTSSELSLASTVLESGLGGNRELYAETVL